MPILTIDSLTLISLLKLFIDRAEYPRSEIRATHLAPGLSSLGRIRVLVANRCFGSLHQGYRFLTTTHDPNAFHATPSNPNRGIAEF